MNFTVDAGIPAITVFLQGVVSFFSPCILPLLPLYIGYLSGGTARRGEDGRVYYEQKKVMLHTVFFVLGISFAFFLLGMGSTVIGRFFRGNQAMFARIGGILAVGFGLYQLGFFGPSRLLSGEHRLPFSVNAAAMSPVTAVLLGFTFSFAWTPCVGPALTSVLLMAASAESQARGFFLIGVYTLGFVLPFLAAGAFSTSILELFCRHGNVVVYTVKIGAVLMIFMGVMMFTGKMNSITGYLSAVQEQQAADSYSRSEKNENAAAAAESSRGAEETAAAAESGRKKEPAKIPAVDFTLTDQYGNSHTFSDYKGKTVFLNFWATWCPPCRREMPDIQKLYEEYQKQEDPEVIILGIAAPGYGQEQSEEKIIDFLEENGYSYPVVMDPGGRIFEAYGVYSYPTTFMIDKDGNIFGYLTGQMSEDMMRSIIRQTVTGIRVQ